MKANVQNIIEDFAHLPLDDREYVVDVVKKQLIEARRDAIAKRASAATSNFKKGAIKKGSIKDLYKDLENG
ncbi:MAG TPA: hypothetical protein PKW17_12735 [Smithellaceae bacterium]|nr:hypothetical protein [Smithellaceae bacterium]